MQNRQVNIHTHCPTGEGIELRATGIHPWHAEGARTVDLLPLAPTVQAIGEIGLDFVRGASRPEQLRVLREQLRLAEKADLPVVLHCVRAFEPLMKELERQRLRAVIFHGFIGSPEQARRAAERGYYLSFGTRTFRSPKTLQALRVLPLDRLFCETDDDPVAIGDVYEQVARARNVSLAELTDAVWQNYLRIFGNDDR